MLLITPVPFQTAATAAPTPPSDWIIRFTHLLLPGATVLDLACGSGRHLRWLAAQGCRVTGVDRDAVATAPPHELAEIVVADLEGADWPLAGRRFDAVVVTNYLWRPHLADALDAVAPGGLLLYETFGAQQGQVGRPSRAEFLLQPGELLAALPASNWRVVAYEDGWLDAPRRHVQRVAALRNAGAAPAPAPLLTAARTAPGAQHPGRVGPAEGGRSHS